MHPGGIAIGIDASSRPYRRRLHCTRARKSGLEEDAIVKELNTLLALIVLLSAPATGGAQEMDARLDAALAERALPMAVTSEGIRGPGADMLIAAGREASFFALGESHLNRETPALAAALLAALAPAGYSVLAIETGPMIAEHAQAELRAGNTESLARLLAETPFTAPFIDHAPEFELLETSVGLGYDLWGLDQVFAGGARFNLARLVELAPNPEARGMAEDALNRAREGFIRFAQSGDSSAGFLQSTDAPGYSALRSAFSGVDEASRIIDELAASSRIYQLYGQGANYQSNHQRIELMKRHLADRLRETDAATRVFMKFGSVHMQRGYSPLNQLDLGNAAAELGVLRGGGSIHVKVTALGSVDADGEFDSWIEQSPLLKRFEAAMPEGSSWAVFDLRPLRPIFHDRDNATGREALSELVWGYDVLVLARQFTRAGRLPGVPAPPGR